MFMDNVNNQCPISAICIQESWAHYGIDMRYFSLLNYTMVNQNRRLSTHGGLIIYIHDDFAYKELNNQLPITCTSTLFESLFIEMWRKNHIHQKYIIGNIYRLLSYKSDDLFTNVIDKDHTCGILIRPISDHQMYFCILNENFFKPITKQKYIEIEQCHEDSLEKFRVEIANATIYDKLDEDLFANPNDNYEVMSKILQNAKNLHMPKKI